MPFCDHRIVEYAWNIPFEMKHYRGKEKGLLREALRGILPEEVLWRKKSPFPKTYDPGYERIVKGMLTEILHDSTSPLLWLVDVPRLERELAAEGGAYMPWFGQLMSRPQLYAYLIQTDIWLRETGVQICV
jgi:asparagine synthase (glutamine-hydrolysing)